MAHNRDKPTEVPAQEQDRQPGSEEQLRPDPQSTSPGYLGSGKLQGKVALITGGDSGIGRAVAVLFAREGANVAIGYLDEHEDAEKTRDLVLAEGGDCLLLAGNIEDEAWCNQLVADTVAEYGRLDVLVNNAAVQYPQDGLADISREQLEKTFRTNVFPLFHVTARALEHLPDDGTIINTTSVTAYRGNPRLIDYSATKGAIVSFTRTMSTVLAERGIRVNAVAPGPIWTPLIPSSFTEEEVAEFGQSSPLGRPGQPEECAPAYVFLASDDSSYISGQVIHPNGGEIVGS